VAAIPFPLAGEGASTLSVETDVKLVLQVFVAAAWLATSGIVAAASPEEFVKLYAEQAKLADPAFAGFSAERGRELYMKQHPVEGNGMLSCASCHHADPTKATQAHVDQIPCRACHILFSGQPESHGPPGARSRRSRRRSTPTASPTSGRSSTGSTSTAGCC
jgi:hypothetical protein